MKIGGLKRTVLFSSVLVSTCIVVTIALIIVMAPWGDSSPASADAAAQDAVSEVKNISDPSAPETILVNPKDGADEVNPVTPVTITVNNGEVRDVKLSNIANGIFVDGEYDPEGGAWATTQHLNFSSTYLLEYFTVSGARKLTAHRQEFSTVSAAYEANAWTTPGNDATVGVGQPIQVNFSEPVINRSAVEKIIAVDSSAGQIAETHWYSDTMLRIRPKEFWAANSKVTVTIELMGVELGNGMVGNGNLASVINISSERKAVVDDKTKTMSVMFDGKVVKTMPVTLGADHMPSTSGWHVLSNKARTTKFDPRSIGLKPGDEDWYQPFDAQWTFRLSNSGEFVHQALPSAFRSVGVDNVSHGCVGLLPADAQWFWEHMHDGDPVQILNTAGGVLDPLDGFGDWNIPWERWKG